MEKEKIDADRFDCVFLNMDCSDGGSVPREFRIADWKNSSHWSYTRVVTVCKSSIAFRRPNIWSSVRARFGSAEMLAVDRLCCLLSTHG
jgi:hypothetical protein